MAAPAIALDMGLEKVLDALHPRAAAKPPVVLGALTLVCGIAHVAVLGGFVPWWRLSE